MVPTLLEDHDMVKMKMQARLTTQPAFQLVLEAGACEHSQEWAVAALEEAARLGAWGFKVQMFQAPQLVTRYAPTYGDEVLHETRFQWDAFTGSLPYPAWREVKDHADRLGVVFFASVFDEQAVDACEAMDIPLYKVASGDITHGPLLEKIRSTGKPVVLSTGASHLWEVERALGWLDGCQVTLLACNLHYPTPPHEANLARMDTLRQLSGRVGYSDHTMGVRTVLAARALGALMVEKHFTITPELNVGDHVFAITPDELDGWQDKSMSAEEARGSELWGTPFFAPNSGELLARVGARRGIYAIEQIHAGDRFNWGNTGFLRPQGFLSPFQFQELVGRQARRHYLPGDPIVEDEIL